MFKSCNYCRHRKKKCVRPTAISGLHTRCNDCAHLNIECEFSSRNISIKRQKTSQYIASRLPSSTSQQRRFSSAETISVQTHGGCQPQPADTTSRPVEKIILRDGNLDDGDYMASLAEKYYKTVCHLAPFLPDEILRGDDMSQDLILYSSIQLASCLSLHDRRRSLPATSRINSGLQDILRGGEMSLPAAAGILLLLLRLDLDEDIINQVRSPHHSFLQCGTSTNVQANRARPLLQSRVPTIWASYLSLSSPVHVLRMPG
jgi:hypothetical protein